MRRLALLLASSLFAPLASAQVAAPSNAVIPEGYLVLSLVRGLDYPTAIAVGSDHLWVAEAGHLPGLPPTVKQIDVVDGDVLVTTIFTAEFLPAGRFVGPLTGLVLQDGWLWVTHRQTNAQALLVGAISRFRPGNPAATFQTVLSGLPSAGDHSTNDLVFDRTGRAYFSQGTATNSGVVGSDSELVMGWLGSAPRFHDYPAMNVVLSGATFETTVPIPQDPQADDFTAPFQPFASGPLEAGIALQAPTASSPQQGIVAGNGAVYSFDPDAPSPMATLRLEAWGLRNPYGIGIDPFETTQLFVTNNGADVRTASTPQGPTVVEARPIANDWDDLFLLRVGGAVEFFGFPDFFHHPFTGTALPVTTPLFCQSPTVPIPCPTPLFEGLPPTQRAFAELEIHSSANKFDFSTEAAFGFVGDLFIAETGAFVPSTGAQEFTGYEVVKVNRHTGSVRSFFENVGKTPDEIFDPEGLNKPIDVKFQGSTMLVVDFGVFEPGIDLAQRGTGKIWAIFHLLPGAESSSGGESVLRSGEPPVPAASGFAPR